MQKKLIEIEKVLPTEVDSEIGLLTGLGGQVLTCSELFLQEKISQDRLSQLRGVLEEMLATENFVFTYCGGLSGVGWLYEYLSQRKIIDYDTNELLEEFDIYLEKALINFMLNDVYDFLHGGVGVALYFSKRTLKKKELATVLNCFLEDLHKKSIKQEDGVIKWLSFLGEQYEQPHGYNIALSHGMSSIVAILSKILKIEGIDKEKTEALLRGVVQYILLQEIDKNQYGCFFPNLALESTPIIHKSRLAWCYGDLGIASALFQAGKALEEKTWIEKALEVLVFAATKRRSLQENFVQDAGLCHGTAGIGHIFYRMWWNTKLPEFRDAANYWFKKTVEMARFSDGLAGFKSFEMPDGKPVWKNDYSFLTGITGIGLAMLTYYHEIEPEWDECLLLS